MASSAHFTALRGDSLFTSQRRHPGGHQGNTDPLPQLVAFNQNSDGENRHQRHTELVHGRHQRGLAKLKRPDITHPGDPDEQRGQRSKRGREGRPENQLDTLPVLVMPQCVIRHQRWRSDAALPQSPAPGCFWQCAQHGKPSRSCPAWHQSLVGRWSRQQSATVSWPRAAKLTAATPTRPAQPERRLSLKLNHTSGSPSPPNSTAVLKLKR